MSRYNLTDREWNAIRVFLPAERPKKAGRPWNPRFSRLAANAAHAIATKGMSLHKRAGDLTIEIQIADLEFGTRTRFSRGVARRTLELGPKALPAGGRRAARKPRPKREKGPGKPRLPGRQRRFHRRAQRIDGGNGLLHPSGARTPGPGRPGSGWRLLPRRWRDRISIERV